MVVCSSAELAGLGEEVTCRSSCCEDPAADVNKPSRDKASLNKRLRPVSDHTYDRDGILSYLVSFQRPFRIKTVLSTHFAS